MSSALTSGRITSLALCTASRERATALQSSLNAFLWIETDERVRRDAEESDQRRQRGVFEEFFFCFSFHFFFFLFGVQVLR